MAYGGRLTSGLGLGGAELCGRSMPAAWGSAKAFGRFIHWMERPLCLLTFLGGASRLFAQGTLSPAPLQAFCKRLERKLYVTLTGTFWGCFWICFAARFSLATASINLILFS